MITSSPALHTASNVETIASVEPQQTVSSLSGSTLIPCHCCICQAMASRRFFAPQVIAYGFMSHAVACCADSLISRGAGKSGNPCARLTAPYCIAWPVISGVPEPVKGGGLALGDDVE